MLYVCGNFTVRMKITLLTVFSVIGLITMAQTNLVPNGGFEDYVNCPVAVTVNQGDFNSNLFGWYCPTDGTTDYFNTCATPNDPNVGVPANQMGYRLPHNGNGYAGIYLSRNVGVIQDYTEYLQIALTHKLKAGASYCVSFYVSVPESSPMRYTTDAIGAQFSYDSLTSYGNSAIHNWKLQGPWPVTNPTGNYILPQSGWVHVYSIYVANGFENYLTIGNTAANLATPMLQIQPDSVASENAAYFYIDDVSVCHVQNSKTDTLICNSNIPLLELTARNDANAYVWSTGDTSRLIRPMNTGLYWVEYYTGCEVPVRDTFNVTILPPAAFTLAADTFLCTGTTLQLSPVSTGGAISSYQWNNGAHTASIQTDVGGEFVLEASNKCGTDIDTIVIQQYDKPDINLPASIDLCVNGELQPLLITSTTALTNYEWSTGETTDAITISQPGQYWLASENVCGTTRRYFDAEGCPLPFAKIYIPNAFSPNGDGNNDVWAVLGDSVRINSITVFNRWGEKVFEADSNTGWDGTYQSQLQPAGVYVYYIKCSDLLTTEPRHYKGSLTLLR